METSCRPTASAEISLIWSTTLTQLPHDQSLKTMLHKLCLPSRAQPQRRMPCVPQPLSSLVPVDDDISLVSDSGCFLLQSACKARVHSFGDRTYGNWHCTVLPLAAETSDRLCLLKTLQFCAYLEKKKLDQGEL